VNEQMRMSGQRAELAGLQVSLSLIKLIAKHNFNPNEPRIPADVGRGAASQLASGEAKAPALPVGHRMPSPTGPVMAPPSMHHRMQISKKSCAME
jgi:hypothetical protein